MTAILSSAGNQRRDEFHAEGDRLREAGEETEGPDDGHDCLGGAAREELAQRVDDGEEAVDGDDDERDDGHVDGELLDEGRDAAEELREVPALQQRRLELVETTRRNEVNPYTGRLKTELDEKKAEQLSQPFHREA